MRKLKKKRLAGVCGIIALLFIPPLIVFAVVYHSSERRNEFVPGSADIKVNEGNGSSDEGEELTKDYTWVLSGENYIADKNVRIKDSRRFSGEMLRLCFIPMWYDSNGNVCTVFNFGTPVRSGNKLTYTDSTDKTLTLNFAADWEENDWSYNSSDGCFYYRGPLDSSGLTAQLLDSVELSKAAYDALTANYVFRLDVLADAIQKTDSSQRWSNSNT